MNSTKLVKLINLLEKAEHEGSRNLAAQKIFETSLRSPEAIPELTNKLADLVHSQSWQARLASGKCLGMIFTVLHKKVQEYVQQVTGNNSLNELLVELSIHNHLQNFNTEQVVKEGCILTSALDLEEQIKESKPSKKAKQTKPKQKITREKEIQKTSKDLQQFFKGSLMKIQSMLQESTQEYQELENIDFKNYMIIRRKLLQLVTQVFEQKWEVRHGSLVCLRELVKIDLALVGLNYSSLLKLKKLEVEKQECIGQNQLDNKRQVLKDIKICNQEILNEFLIRLLCILTLDRFGDFLLEHVVTPVRETAAQIIAFIGQQLNDAFYQLLIDKLACMGESQEWEIRYAVMLTIKYLLAVVPQVKKQILLKRVYNVIVHEFREGLSEDVVLIASDSLQAAVYLKCALSHEQISKLNTLVWPILASQESNSSSIESILKLVKELKEYQNNQQTIKQKQIIEACVEQEQGDYADSCSPNKLMDINRKALLEMMIVVSYASHMIDNVRYLVQSICGLYLDSLQQQNLSFYNLKKTQNIGCYKPCPVNKSQKNNYTSMQSPLIDGNNTNVSKANIVNNIEDNKSEEQNNIEQQQNNSSCNDAQASVKLLLDDISIMVLQIYFQQSCQQIVFEESWQVRDMFVKNYTCLIFKLSSQQLKQIFLKNQFLRSVLTLFSTSQGQEIQSSQLFRYSIDLEENLETGFYNDKDIFQQFQSQINTNDKQQISEDIVGHKRTRDLTAQVQHQSQPHNNLKRNQQAPEGQDAQFQQPQITKHPTNYIDTFVFNVNEVSYCLQKKCLEGKYIVGYGNMTQFDEYRLTGLSLLSLLLYRVLSDPILNNFLASTDISYIDTLSAPYNINHEEKSAHKNDSQESIKNINNNLQSNSLLQIVSQTIKYLKSLLNSNISQHRQSFSIVLGQLGQLVNQNTLSSLYQTFQSNKKQLVMDNFNDIEIPGLAFKQSDAINTFMGNIFKKDLEQILSKSDSSSPTENSNLPYQELNGLYDKLTQSYNKIKPYLETKLAESLKLHVQEQDQLTLKNSSTNEQSVYSSKQESGAQEVSTQIKGSIQKSPQVISNSQQELKQEPYILIQELDKQEARQEQAAFANVNIVLSSIQLYVQRYSNELDLLNNTQLSQALTNLTNLCQRIMSTQLDIHLETLSLVASCMVFFKYQPQSMNLVVQPLMGMLRKTRVDRQGVQDTCLQALSTLIVDINQNCYTMKKGLSSKIVKNIILSSSVLQVQLAQQGEQSDDVKDDNDMFSQNMKASAYVYKQFGKIYPADLLDQLPILKETLQCLLNINSEKSQIDQMQEENFLNEILQAVIIIQGACQSIGDSLFYGEFLQYMQAINKTCYVVAPHRMGLIHLIAKTLSIICHRDLQVQQQDQMPQIDRSSQQQGLMVVNLLQHLGNLLDIKNLESVRIVSSIILLTIIGRLLEYLLPYIILIFKTLIASISDPNTQARQTCAKIMGIVMPILPLTLDLDPDQNYYFNQQQIQQYNTNRKIVIYLVDSGPKNKGLAEQIGSLPDLNMQLREYQREGIQWLEFLRVVGLHGVLADDMGLGKTMQTVVIIAKSQKEQLEVNQQITPSLVVCPATLVPHWQYEVQKTLNESERSMSILQYYGTQAQRNALATKLHSSHLVITSYENLRSDIQDFEQLQWDYCVLDEGHIIRNAKSKIAMACKRIKARHRLILSGTPIQNNVLELWSLFDFLMPDYLGNEKYFQTLYGKAVQGSKNAKKESKEFEQGQKALELLHKRVLPFILRRTKDLVLKELPPKTIQDILCQMSPIQQQIIRLLWTKSHYKMLAQNFESIIKEKENHDNESQLNLNRNLDQTIVKDISDGDVEHKKSNNSSATMQADVPQKGAIGFLHVLRKLCTHPVLLCDESQEQWVSDMVTQAMKDSRIQSKDQLKTLEHAPKLQTLQDLIQQCIPPPIGTRKGQEKKQQEDYDVLSSEIEHKIIVFAQLRATLDLAETLVFKNQLSYIQFLRLDGTLDSRQRFEIARKFNEDTKYQVLLLTTHVGGLGLNLTSADIVIFLEHDWNPMRDLQAMDRAHRLGQRRNVLVYRILVEDTLEQRILNLQQFKIDVANQVINSDNMSTEKIEQDQILDQIGLSQEDKKQIKQKAQVQGDHQVAQKLSQVGKKSLDKLIDYEQLQNEKNYESEFNIEGLGINKFKGI